jgi:hypothetical protein
MCALSHIIIKAITDDLQQAPEQGLNGEVQMIPTAKRAPEIIRFVDRDEAKLPDFFLPRANGVVVAGMDLMRAAELSHGPDRKLDWRMMDANWAQSLHGDLEVAKFGNHWFIGRKGRDLIISETLVEAFGKIPVCTPTSRDAMLLAEYCHPEVGWPLPGHWMKFQ